VDGFLASPQLEQNFAWELILARAIAAAKIETGLNFHRMMLKLSIQNDKTGL
jgi:hypothetical protein